MSHSPSPSSSPSASASDACEDLDLRVTPAEVLKIMLDVSDTYTDDPECVIPFIIAAHNMVQNIIVADEGCGALLTECVLREIERWLAAHMLACVDQKLTSEKFGDGEDRYQGKWDVGFDATNYGQQVMRMDPCGLLGTANEKVKTASRKLIFKARGR